MVSLPAVRDAFERARACIEAAKAEDPKTAAVLRRFAQTLRQRAVRCGSRDSA